MENPTWPIFYGDFAEALLTFTDRRQELFERLRSLGHVVPLMSYLHLNNAEYWGGRDYEVDPFTVMGIFNRATSDVHRHNLALLLADMLGMENRNAPTVFHGIPSMDPRHSIFNGNGEMWALMEAARSEQPLGQNFVEAWNNAIEIKGNALDSLSMGLFWANPSVYMPIDRMSRPLLKNKFSLDPPDDKCSGEDYLAFLHSLAQKTTGIAYPDLTLFAWKQAHEE